jgi:hypothetical protein
MANQQLPAGDNEQLEKNAKVIPFRGIFGKWLATATYANTFTRGNFAAAGQDLAGDAAKVQNPGYDFANNMLGSDAKPLFKIMPQAVGIYISDPGDARVRSILIETGRLEFKVGDSMMMPSVPLLAMPPGLGVDRMIATQVSGASPSFERHGIPSPISGGIYPVSKGWVLAPEKKLTANLFIPDASLAALAALTGSTPAQGFGVLLVVYGRAAQKVALS